MLHRYIGDGSQVDRRRVVDADIDAVELLKVLGHSRLDGIRVTDVPDDWQCLVVRVLELLGRGVDRVGQLGVRLGDQGHIGSIIMCRRVQTVWLSQGRCRD